MKRKTVVIQDEDHSVLNPTESNASIQEQTLHINLYLRSLQGNATYIALTRVYSTFLNNIRFYGLLVYDEKCTAEASR